MSFKNTNCILIDFSWSRTLGNYFFKYMLAYILSQEFGVPLYFMKESKSVIPMLLSNVDIQYYPDDYTFSNEVVEVPTHLKDYSVYKNLLETKNNITLNVTKYSMNIFLYEKYKNIFKKLISNKLDVPYFDEDYLVINLRLSVADRHRDYTPIPHKFYKKIIEETKLIPVFMGETQDSSIMSCIKTNFPTARIEKHSKNPYYDFELLRQAKNKCICVSSFSFLAAYFGEENTKIHMPVIGMYSPTQREDLNFINENDKRFTYYTDFPSVLYWEHTDTQILELTSL